MKKVVSLALAAAALAVVACSNGGGKQSQKSVIDLASIKASKATPQEKAEAIALAGERIAYGPGFMHASELFDVALEFDSSNVRARTYKAILTPAMNNRGVLTRIRPIVRKLDAKAQQEYQKSIVDLPAGDLKTFLLDGQEDITNEKDIQAFVHSLQDDLRGVRKSFGDLSSQTITLHANVPVTDAQPSEIARDCQVQKVSSDVYYVYECDVYKKQDVTLEYADWEAGRLMVAATQIYYTLWNAYDITGLENVAKKLAGYQNPSDRQVISIIQQEAEFGKLVDFQTLKEVLDMGAEGVQAVKYAVSKQGSLCPAGYPANNSRPGKLINQGLCVDAAMVHALPTADAALRGPISVVLDVFRSSYHNENYNGYNYSWYEKSKVGNYYTTIDGTKPFNGSATDLKALLPTQFDSCGNATNLPDGTMAGVFTNGDAVTSIQTNNPDFLKKSCVQRRN
jgi:hypothetical protein